MNSRTLAILLPVALAGFGGAAMAQTAATPTEQPAAVASEPTPEMIIQGLSARLAQTEQALANHRVQLAQVRSEIALKDELIVLGRERNAELYGIAQEILERYGDIGWSEMVTRREPFIQTTRVRLENSIQDYEDRLRAARIYESTLPPSVERRMTEELERRQAEAAPPQDPPAADAAPQPDQ